MHYLCAYFCVFVPAIVNDKNKFFETSSELRTKDGKYFNWPMSLEEIAVAYPDLRLGGFYPGSKTCKCRSFNAIIVPYRDREEHLR